MIELLLQRGANPLLLDKHNNTPQALAEKKGEKEVIALLEAYIAASKEKSANARNIKARRKWSDVAIPKGVAPPTGDDVDGSALTS